MNGGPPAVALRAVRVAPVLVDDLALTRAVDGSAWAANGSPDPEIVRWARAWTIGWQSVLHARGIVGAADPWTVALSPADWPELRGDPDRHRLDAAVALLKQVGLADSRGDGAVTLGPRAFVPHRAGLELDWGAAFRACRGEPAALLTLRAVVDGLAALDDPAPLTLRELASRSGYGEKQVRTALQRLIAAGVLATRESPGQPTRYRITDALLGRGGPAPAAPVGPQRLSEAPAPASPPAPSHQTAPAFRLSLNGATVAIAAGMTASVELDADGVPHVHLTAPPGT
ncbi:hypothetical protein tb265_46670 [Gemmatimonadetes bacterium T265]|nr:hypothetical protein tb265_46670 [Gemmatimonadetes bacterium T265]